MFKSFDDIVAAAEEAALGGDIEKSEALIKQANAVKAVTELRKSQTPQPNIQRLPFFDANQQAQGQTGKAKPQRPENHLFYNAVKSLLQRDADKVFLHIEGESITVDSTTAAIKAMSGDVSNLGGTWVPNVQSKEIVDFLYSNVVLKKAGITEIPVRDNVGGTINMPSFTSGFTANWVGTNTAATSQDVTTGVVSLTPRELVAVARLPKNLINDSNPQIESFIRRGLSESIGVALDKAGFEGTGTAPQPRGLRNISGIVSTAIGSATLMDALIAASARMTTNKLPLQKRAFFCHPLVFSKLLSLKDSNGQYVIAGAYEGNANGPDGVSYLRRLGIPVYTTPEISNDGASGQPEKSKGYLLYAPEYMYADRQTIEISTSDIADGAFLARQVLLMATLRGDFALGRAAACEIISDILH